MSLAQIDFEGPIKACNVSGSITIFDYQKQSWLFSDSADAKTPTLPASTFKIINLLIALETGVIKDEHEVIKWPGSIDTTLYGYRPDTYHDMTVKYAFEVSAAWVFIELAKRIGREKYINYLNLCGYGDGNLTEKGTDFWNFGAFGVSPVNQIQFLIKVYKGETPFLKRNLEILKKVMLSESAKSYSIYSKTGWTRVNEKDVGWWVGYVDRKDNAYFFATRIMKDKATSNSNFGPCRKDITKEILKQIKAFE